MNQYYHVIDHNARAVMTANFSVVQCLLQDQPDWGAEVLERAGEYRWRVWLVRRWSWGMGASRIAPDTTERFIAFAPVSRRTYLAYEIHKLDENHIQVVPVGYLPTAFKVANLVALLLLMVIPALLAPFVWGLYEAATLRNSRLYLDAFCRTVLAGLETPALPDAGANSVRSGDSVPSWQKRWKSLS